MKNYGTRFIWIFLLTAVCAWLFAKDGLKLGLDLKGGASITYLVTAEDGVDERRMQKAIDVIEKRLNSTGLGEVYVSALTGGQLLIEMPGRSKSEIEGIKKLIERNGALEFRMVAPQKDQVESGAMKRDAPQYYKDPPNMRWVPVKASERAGASEILVEVKELTAKAKVDALHAAGKTDSDPEVVAALRELAEIVDKSVFVGADLASVSVENHGTEIVVAFKMKDNRAVQFGDYTEANIKRQMAIILDGVVHSSPEIQSALRGSGQINGGSRGFDPKDAEELAIVLDSGSTGVHLSLEREESLGASMGEVAISRGKWSVGLGFLAVVLIMLWWYRLPGVVAIVALVLNVVIMLGSLAFFRAALSLPGIAGIVLTLGMAVDANILIFERLRDERRRGKSLSEALAAGYDRAMSAIIDSNVTTILTAIVLIVLGSGAVRGFGVTLTLGLLASLFTSTFVTRTIFEWAVEKNLIKKFDIGPEPFHPTWDYMKLRKWFTIPSIVLMTLGAVAFLARDEAESKDIEFVGGQQLVIQLKAPATADDVTRIAQGANQEYQSATPVPLASATSDAKDGTTDRYQIRVKAKDQAEGDAYVAYLAKAFEGRLVPPPFTDWKTVPGADGKPASASFTVNLLTPPTDPSKLGAAIAAPGTGVPGATLEPIEGTGGRSFKVTMPDASKDAAAAQDTVGQAVRTLSAEGEPLALSDPFPVLAFLASGPAKKMWKVALEAVFLSLLIQVIYIRLRFADYAHGFAAVMALLHDTCIALGCVAVADAAGLVYAKVNLTLIAAFLTLIGFSMNDTIVVFDRMRENLGKNGVLRSKIINDSVNQTFARSIRTTATTWLVVLIQFLLNRNLGSVLEGFAWVMVTGCIAGTYSSVFVAAPLLLFLPGYGRILFGKPILLAVQVAVTLVGVWLAMTGEGHGLRTWLGFALASNIPLHFVAYLVPWLMHEDPDSLVESAEQGTADDRPLHAPGI